MPENEDFCLSFELFSWVSDFLSFGVLDFFRGCTKKTHVNVPSNAYFINLPVFNKLEIHWLRSVNNKAGSKVHFIPKSGFFSALFRQRT